jgi:hypothetical protein
MGFPPPPAGPPPAAPGASVDAGLADSPTAASLCGFKFPPEIFFKFGFKLPSINFPPPLPIPHIQLALNCDLNNPLSVDAGLSYGGGRSSNADPNPDDLEQAA